MDYQNQLEITQSQSETNNEIEMGSKENNIVISQQDIENPEIVENKYDHKPLKIDANNTINKEMRLGFIRRVYALLSLQLAITILICLIPFFSKSLGNFFREAEWLFWLSVILSFAVIIPLLCFKKLARKIPINYVMITLWTACEAFMIARLCSFLNPQTVLLAAVITLAAVTSLTVYAWKTSTDYSLCSSLLYTSTTLLVLTGLFGFWLPFSNVLYCVAGVFIFSLYIVLDTQMIISKFGTEYDVEDYIIATINIYLDILQLFIFILQLFSNRN